MEKIPFEDGTKIKDAVVEINEQEYTVTPAQYTGNTPLTAANLNLMQDNIEDTLVKASSIQPDADIWFRKTGKNLFDGNYNTNFGYSQSTGEIIAINNIFSSSSMMKIPSGSTQLACSKNGSGIMVRFFFYNSEREFLSTGTSTSGGIISIPTSAEYCHFQVGNDIVSGSMSGVQVEVRSVTSYEEYIEPTIFVKNENGIYEEFIKKEGKVVKYGSITNPDETTFQITRSRVIQVENTVYVDLTVKILKQISSNNQYNFAINGVNPPSVATFVMGSYGSNEYTHTNVLYVYVFQGTCYINNVSMNSAVNGYWKIHFVYNVD